jgi:hypothetical protein
LTVKTPLFPDPPHPNLRLEVGGEVALLDLLRTELFEFRRSSGDQKLPLNLRGQDASIVAGFSLVGSRKGLRARLPETSLVRFSMARC